MQTPLRSATSKPSLKLGSVFTAGAFLPGSKEVSSAGYAGLFHFPFRILASEALADLSGAGKEFRYHVYRPFLLRESGSPITQDIPEKVWTDFRWHPDVDEKIRQFVGPVDLHYGSPSGERSIGYDGLRCDIVGKDASNRVSVFVASGLRWLRHLSGQSWIGDVDRHYLSSKKRSFPIDESGMCVGQVIPLAQMKIAGFNLVSQALWQRAFENAAISDVPIYSNLFFDAVNAAAVDEFQRAVISLAVAIESSLLINFSRIHKVDPSEEQGSKLRSPFHPTNFVKNLSGASKAAFGRDFSSEHPQQWDALVALRAARGNAAHGKAPHFRIGGRIAMVDRNSFPTIQSAVWQSLDWIEAVARFVSDAGC